MCKWGTNVEVKLCKLRRNSAGKPYDMVYIDACIAPIVQALNDAGIETLASCCGHEKIDGSIILTDGRELVIRPVERQSENQIIRNAANKVILCFPDKIPAGQEEVAFNIPAYIIEELKQALKKGGK